MSPPGSDWLPWLSGVAAACAVLLLLPAPARLRPPVAPSPASRADPGWMQRHRALWSLLAGAGALLLLGGALGLVAAPAAAVGIWVAIGRAEPPDVRREREAVRRDLPHVVGLFGDALRSGQAPADALAVVATALPGPAAERLGVVLPRLRLGADPADVWRAMAADPLLAPLGRALGRAHETGAPVGRAVERLADELARDARARAEDRARAVGVKAAVPLGLCLLPAFVLVGIVPLAVGLLGTLGL